MTVQEAGRKGGEKTAQTMDENSTVKLVARVGKRFAGLFGKEKNTKKKQQLMVSIFLGDPFFGWEKSSKAPKKLLA